MFGSLPWMLILVALAGPAQTPRPGRPLPGGGPPPGGRPLPAGRTAPVAPSASWIPLSTAEQFAMLLKLKEVGKEIGVESPPQEMLADLRQLVRGGGSAEGSDSTKGAEGLPIKKRAEGPPTEKGAEGPPTDPAEYLAIVEKHCGRAPAKRLRELRFQALGLRFAAKADPELARALSLSPSQTAGLGELPIAGLPEQLGGSSGEALRAVELRFLTESQRGKWQEACGTPSTVQLPPLISVAGFGGKVRVPQLLAGGGFARVLGDPAVQKDLSITERQQGKLDGLITALKEGDAAALEGVPERVEYDELASLAEKRRDAARKTIQDALGTDVEKRVSQIARQQAGLLPSLRSDPEIERLLAVTNEQHDKLAFLLQSGALPTPPRVVGRPTPEMFGQFREYRRIVDEAIFDQVLTAEQRDVWKELTGEPLDVDLKLLPFLPAPPPRSRTSEANRGRE